MTKSQKVSASILKRIEDKEKAVQAYIDRADYDKLVEIAGKEDRSVSSLLRRWINEYLKTYGSR